MRRDSVPGRSGGVGVSCETGVPSASERAGVVSVFPAPMLRWALLPAPDPAAVALLAGALGIPAPLAALLVQRGQGSEADARTFLRPAVTALSDPFALAGMADAVDAIVSTVRTGGSILVHGDYDVDGQCATALLTRALRAAGADVVGFVPHRLRDGYDFGPAGLAAAQAAGASLVVTCDCGITAVETVRAARAAGIGVVVTDHHLPGPELPPALAVVDPQRQDDSSGAGAGSGAGPAAQPALPPAGSGGAGHRGRRRATGGREPDPGPPRPQASSRQPLARTPLAGRGQRTRRAGAPRRAHGLHPGSAAQRRRAGGRCGRRPPAAPHRRSGRGRRARAPAGGAQRGAAVARPA